MRLHSLLAAFVLTSISLTVTAQKKQVSDGNKLYQQQKYKEATAAYQQALKKNPTFTPGMFNLGNALFQQKNYEGARQVMSSAAKQSKDKQVRSDANYNVGNTYMQEQKWEQAVDAYKQSLRNNPQDEAAKYNLSYALTMLKKQQQGGGGKDDKNKDDQQNKDKNQNQDKNDQNKDQDKQDNKQPDNNKEQDQKEDQQKEQQQRPQPQPSKLSEQQAEQMLNALSQEEKKLHDKKEKGKAMPVKTDKDW